MFTHKLVVWSRQKLVGIGSKHLLVASSMHHPSKILVH